MKRYGATCALGLPHLARWRMLTCITTPRSTDVVWQGKRVLAR